MCVRVVAMNGGGEITVMTRTDVFFIVKAKGACDDRSPMLIYVK